MSPSKKKSTQKKRTNGKRSNWKNLKRDSRGRWISSKTTKKPSAKVKKPIKKDLNKTFSGVKEEKKVANILNHLEHDFTVDCPRCSGDLKHFRIRCGPDRLISVKKCIVCNYWIPLSDN
ncbi:MAG: hypothetical protein ACTSRX_04630 [Promethearchaeota archaeon]